MPLAAVSSRRRSQHRYIHIVGRHLAVVVHDRPIRRAAIAEWHIRRGRYRGLPEKSLDGAVEGLTGKDTAAHDGA
eukprot:579961-Prymnesium_polylepis.1